MKFQRTLAVVVASITSLAVALPLVACGGQHVALRSPGPDAPIQQRVAAYEFLRPVSLSMTHVTEYQNGHYAGSYVVTNHLQLRGGVLVARPDDLLPVVLPGSATASFVNGYLRNRAGARRSWAAASLLMIGGLAVTMMSLSDLEDESRFNALLYTGTGISLAGCIVMIPAYVFGARAGRDRNAAFVSYENDLPEALGFCIDSNGQPADCGASSAAPVFSPLTR